jgi:hypothetical protein
MKMESNDGTVVMWRGVTRPCTAYPDASLGPRARLTDALGVPRTVLPLTPALACYTLPAFEGRGIPDGLRGKAFHEAGASDAAAATAT